MRAAARAKQSRPEADEALLGGPITVRHIPNPPKGIETW